MTMTPDAPAVWNLSPGRVAGYSLSAHAREQMSERGFTAEQLATVMMNPAYRERSGTRSNDNMTVFVDERSHVITAVLRHGEFDELAEATRRRPAPSKPAERPAPTPEPRRRRPAAPPVQRSHVLDSIHSALRKEIIKQVAGDFSRLVIHSPTSVTIMPE